MMQSRRKTMMSVLALSFFCCALSGWGAEGLQIKIEKVTIGADLKPQVAFTLQDNAGAPLALTDISAPRFILARLDLLDAAKGSARYWSYSKTIAKATDPSPFVGATAEQATYDSGGTTVEVSAGKYVYTFKTVLPADYDQTKTHTVSAQIERVRPNNEGPRHIANPLYHFVPNGGEVVTLRKVVTTEGCNKCHDGLGLHGGGRREVGLCILCHSTQTTDPDTGNTVDMSVMIHKIHMGADLPSVKAGKPYQIIGYRQSVADYSHVEFPQDNRNCATCHDGEQGDIFKKAPSRAVCGSCHDDVNFQTGEGHSSGIPQADDSMCAVCHPADGQEFDRSVSGSHTVPAKSKSLKGVNAEILEITNAAPGQAPNIRFSLKENDGTAIDLAKMRSVNITLAGPVKEYLFYLREVADTTKSVVIGGGVYTYQFVGKVPDDAKGTYSFTMEARRNVTLVDKPEGQTDITVTEGADNTMKLVSVTNEAITPRREIVDINKCNVCHNKLAFHGSQRKQTDFCVTCHNTKNNDVARSQGSGESISFGYMIHKIHTGEELEQPFSISTHNYNGFLFPGKRQDCNLCHKNGVPSLPLSSDAAPIDFVNKEGVQIKIAPNAAACLSCHDGAEPAEHAQMFASTGTETCFACHGAGQAEDIAVKHAQSEFLNVIEAIAPANTFVKSWMIH
ncbi:MAG: OmcA/MtrC family decaheme c-type cytochrome [Candidatus Omnitrophota bacterium]